MKEVIQTIYNDRLVHVIDLDEISYELSNLRIGALQIINEPDVAKRKSIFDRATESVKKIDKIIEKYSQTYLIPEEKKVLDEFILAWKNYNASRQNTYSWAIEGKFEEAKHNAQTDAAVKFQNVDEKIRRLIQIQDKVTKAIYDEASRNYASSRNTIIVVDALAVAMTIAFILILTRLIAKPLADLTTNVASKIAQGDLNVDIKVKGKDEIGQLSSAMKKMVENLKEIIGSMKSSADNLASASQQLSANSEQMSKGITEQVGKASQIATSSTEMSQTIIDIAKNASNIASFATEAVKIARDGEGIVSKSVEEVNAIASVVNESADLITSLGNRSRQIGEIVHVIKDIADQTNLLALNAAIEAARAGEQGRGFAVVADEVRKLAERTAKATSEIGEMIKAIQDDVDRAVSSMEDATKKVETGVELSTRTGKALHNIVESVTNLQSMVQQIASATEEMSAVSEQISQDVETVASVTNETSSSATQISQASADLAKLAVKLEGMVSQFRM
jgi:methyl-accepting chemotaxis protein